MNRVESAYLSRVAALGCCVCRRVFNVYSPGEVHHIAEGSGLRSHFAIAPVCPEHHRGQSGFHVLKERAFCARYRVPGESEYGMLVWVNEDLQLAAMGRLRMGAA